MSCNSKIGQSSTNHTGLLVILGRSMGASPHIMSNVKSVFQYRQHVLHMWQLSHQHVNPFKPSNILTRTESRWNSVEDNASAQ